MQKTLIAKKEDAHAPARARQTIALGDIENALVQKGLDLWHERRGERPMPSRADLSPKVLSGLLRNTALIRVLDGGEDFEMRIVGDALMQAQGASLQGMTMSEVDLVLPGYGEALRKVYRRVCETGNPRAYRGWYVREADGHALFHESIVMPLADDGRLADHLLVVGVYARQPGGALR